MDAPESDFLPPAPVGIIQPCSEACACFTRLTTGGGWSDFGVCSNPLSPFKGLPVRLGQECRNYVPVEGTRHPRQA